MKKSYLFIIAVCLLGFNKANAQGWAKTIHAGAGTNVYQNFTFDKDNNPVVIGGAEDYGGGTPNGLVFMKYDKQAGTRSLLKKYNGNTNSESYKVHTDAQGNIYYFGTFTDYIAFGADTLFTYSKVNWNSPNYIIAKFDSEGNHLWSKKFGQKFGTELKQVLDAHFTADGFHAMIGYSSDSVFYDNAFVEKLPYAGTNMANFCLFRVDLTDGSLKTFKKVGGYYGAYPQMFVVNPNGGYEMGVMDIAMTKKFVVYSFTETNAAVVKCSTNISEVNGDGNDIEQVVLHNGNYYALAVNLTARGYSVYNGDSVKVLPSPYNLRTGMLMKFDSAFNLKAHVRFHWRDVYPKLFLSKGKLVVPARFSNTMYIENDSVVCLNNQQAWELMAFNENLAIADTLQLNTANSSGGSFDVECAGYDNEGNLYGQAVHNKNIIYNGTVVQAALKSWDHLTVLFRKGNNIGSGLNSRSAPILQAGVYPNPVSDVINLDVEVNEVSIFNITGKLMLKVASKQADVSGLPQGLYFIQAADGVNRYHSRFIKN
ncbi:MAG: T9SS type A sorting domain-containing protein [Bacteroidota bacterium]